MFDDLGRKLSEVFDGLRGRRHLTERDVDATVNHIRTALLEADVALTVVDVILERVRIRVVGERLIQSVAPADHVAKIVRDVIAEMLTPPEGFRLRLRSGGEGLAVVVMVGLQGSGKTTTAAKLAHYWRESEKRRVALVSVDVHRPAAITQLAVLGQQIQTTVIPSTAQEDPVAIAKRAVREAHAQGCDVLVVDTAGRTTIDASMMDELRRVLGVLSQPVVLLVADSLSGQDAVTTARAFAQNAPLQGAILTRADADGRGGAALAMQTIAGCPLLFLGVGEKIDDLQTVDPVRLANRILGMGDVVALVEKATSTLNQQQMEKISNRMQEGIFDFNDMATQLKQLTSMGGIQSLAALIPGARKMMEQARSRVDESMFKRQIAIIGSMTKYERSHPNVLHASRKQRIAKGSGVAIAEVNKLIKQHQTMATMFRKLRQPGGMDALMRGMPMPDEATLAELTKKMELAGGLPHADMGTGSPSGDLSSLFGMGGVPGKPGMSGMSGITGKRALLFGKKKRPF